MCTGSHPFIPASGVCSLEFICQQEGQRIENVLHFHKEGAWTAAQLALMCSAGASAWSTYIAPQTAVNVTLNLVRAVDLASELGAYAEFSPASAPGGNTGTALPNGVSLRIRATTGLHGRSQRGGPYHIGLVQEMLDPLNTNDITVTAATAIVDAWTEFQHALEIIETSAMVILSYCHNKEWRTTAQQEPITSLGVSDYHLDRQWRRAPGRGR